jgi:large subunit ribosomal protein L35
MPLKQKNVYIGDKMPKMKTKSSAKKRFKFTASGKVIATQANKQHNMRKRSKRQIRNQRGTTILPKVEARRLPQYMPYA